VSQPIAQCTTLGSCAENESPVREAAVEGVLCAEKELIESSDVTSNRIYLEPVFCSRKTCFSHDK
jgi:hypothetical protein